MKQKSIPSRIGLPLLTKELIEQAARKRTYVLRVLYASLLYMAACLMFYELLRFGATSPFAALGRGRQMYEMIVGLQFAGVYLFMPALACGVITHEKERNSLMLLFLTRLGPWAIVFEKLLSRLIPMACFLLLSLPLLAFAYSLGGITTEYLWTGVYLLLVTVFQLGTLALFWSCWARTTVQAFIGSYLTALLLILGPWVAWEIALLGQIVSRDPAVQSFMNMGLYETHDQLMFPLFAPVQFFDVIGTTPGFFKSVLRSIPILVASGGFLVLARAVIVKRAFVPPRNLLLNVFRFLDRQFQEMNNNRLTRGIVLGRGNAALPENEPVAWRETTKRSLGQARYLFRIFLVIETPLLCVCLMLAIFGASPRLEGASFMLILLWLIAVLLVSVQSASLIAGERSHQTLDVLCATPLAGRTILLQKFRSVRRLMIVLLVPFFTLFLFAVFWRSSFHSTGYAYYGRGFQPVLYFVCSALSVGIYLPMIAWLSLLIGLKVRTGGRAIIAALGAIVGWCILPLVFIFMPFIIMFDGRIGPHSGLTFVSLLSPATIIPFNEFGDLDEFARVPWLAVTVNFVQYGFFLVVFRSICLIHADRFLGRAESP